MDVSTGVKQSAAALAAAAAATSGATAADITPFKAAPVPVLTTWEGFYLGGSAGATWLNSDATDPGSVGFVGFTNGYGSTGGAKVSSRALGWLGGRQAGYNFQNGNFVYGVETDFSWLGGSSASSGATVPVSYARSTYAANSTFASKVNELATFRARMGLDFNGTLPYVTAGFATGNTSNTFGSSSFNPTLGPRGAPSAATVTQRSWVPGVVLGGGVEHQLSRNWSIKGEVLWVGFQDKSVVNPLFSTTYGAPTSNGQAAKFSNDLTIAKIGLNYRF